MFRNIKGETLTLNVGDVIRCVGHRDAKGRYYYKLGETYVVHKSRYGIYPVVPVILGDRKTNANGMSGIWEITSGGIEEDISEWL